MTTQYRRRGTLAIILAFAMALTAAVGATVTLAGSAGAAPAAAPSGSYSGTNPQNNFGFVFYVSANRTQLQDISIPTAAVTCQPGNGDPSGSPFGIASLPLNSNGSFNSTTTKHGQFQGFAATFTYNFRGSVHNANRNASAGGAGTFRETVTYNDGIQRNCTSDNQPWTATRQAQAAQTSTAPPSGSYSGTNPQNNFGFVFYVSASRNQLQDISIPTAAVTCLPGNGDSSGSPFGIASLPLNSNGSFNSTTTQHGQFQGLAATFTYTLQGNFHSLDPNGVERAAGTFRETVAYNDGTQRNCTSNNQSWYATRQAQAAQTNSAPPSGTYSGTNPQNNFGFTFSVAGHTLLKNVSIPTAAVTCVPGNGNSTGSPFVMATVPLKPNGSFNTTTTARVQLNGFAATATYTFAGNFHSLDPNGVERAAGMFHETVTYHDGGQVNCTSNNQSWYATRTGG